VENIVTDFVLMLKSAGCAHFINKFSTELSTVLPWNIL